ncbi:protein unc-93 homolog A [Photinus pyralis]|uniref:UNC93-like protein n=1 Tax=Photinus pyralis TaxID=7054 RepID=A0A1Y1NC75_PHOPY|nr:protein unc-93 homolog A [Photinus pyralis]
MGSLPNLSEISREDDTQLCNSRGAPCSFRNERCKIRYRQSERGYLRRPKKHFPSRWTPCDDVTLQQTATSSPASARSTNINHVVRRKDSLTSSIGATSVRRLISVVRNSHNRPGPHYNRGVLIRHLVVFCTSHLFLNATFPPFIVLQGSVSLWTLPQVFFPLGINAGSTLLALMYSMSATSTLFAPYLINKVGVHVVLLYSYGVFLIFYVTHIYPAMYLLIPVYAVLGIALGQLTLSYVSLLMGLSTKMSCAISDYEDDLRVSRLAVIIRRFARAIQASQDLGLIFGSLMVAMIIGYWRPNQYAAPCTESDNFNCTNCAQTEPCTAACPLTFTKNCSSDPDTKTIVENLDSIFDIDEHGNRICGAAACASQFANFPVVHPTVAFTLLIIFVAFTTLALVITVVGLGRLKTYVNQDALDNLEFTTSLRAILEAFKDIKLQLAAPLAVFMGLEQGFVYTDFSKSYIVCTLGIQHVNLVFLSMGVLQSVAACTLSMLLKSIQRYYVVIVGFIFQCCVLMVQILWKPMSDDPALFYVVPAVWGVCNAIWEILTLSLLTSLYADNWSAPFCISNFFRFLGLTVSFLFHSLLCNWIKLYALATLMLFAVIPFFCLELRLAKSNKNLDTSRL